ncbi:uncharacterized protein LOC131229082 isoform X1 [Magnolia sinica]|uniref:uncharacterized protein LOC131229082 isoform X1 n=1 Tax=Magnolia sinica TaxID=86752 RepID=UPI0026595E97|nr:uncharacterized protein LOC131229082 isoform X1 [Magnolia sinica]
MHPLHLLIGGHYRMRKRMICWDLLCPSLSLTQMQRSGCYNQFVKNGRIGNVNRKNSTILLMRLTRSGSRTLMSGSKRISGRPSFSFGTLKRGRGIVLSKDPLTKVGGFSLGNGFWEVYIQVAIVCEETLMRPYGRYRTIGDAAGSSICWPDCCCLVVTAMD